MLEDRVQKIDRLIEQKYELMLELDRQKVETQRAAARGDLSSASAMLRLEEYDQQIDALRDQIERLRRDRHDFAGSTDPKVITNAVPRVTTGKIDMQNPQAVAVETSMNALHRLMLQGQMPSRKRDEMADDLEKLLSPLLNESLDIFGLYSSGAVYSAAVYLLNPDSHCIEPIWGQHHLAHPDPYRAYQPGHSHVGRVYQANRFWICADTLLETGPSLFDEVALRSFMAVAFTGHGRNRAAGVLLITSDQPSQFAFDEVIFVCHMYRHLLSIYFNHFGLRGAKTAMLAYHGE